MPKCLGIYIDNDVIKYAKISQEHENFKVETFGIKFYENLETTISQIMAETYSYKDHIAVNIANEKYTYSDVFSLLNKDYLDKAIETEFEDYCNQNSKNKSALEYRKNIVKNLEDDSKKTILYIYTEKSNIVSRMQSFEGLNLTAILPTSIAISALKNFKLNENSIIINIENKTTVTTILEGKIYRIDTINEGMKDILEEIKLKENSYSKAYEICKNSTIYTIEELDMPEDNQYMQVIVPKLYRIIEEVQNIIRNNNISINNIYISGMGAVINNVDLYFQDNFPDKKCEILKPYFIENMNNKVNIKDYIEVNSAIAIATLALKPEEKELNFRNKKALEQIFEKIWRISNISIDLPGNKKIKKNSEINIKEKINNDLKRKIDNIEKVMIWGIGILIASILLYSGISIYINKIVDEKKQETNKFISDTQTKIDETKNYLSLINTKKDEYKALVENYNEKKNIKENYDLTRSIIPKFLTQISEIVPDGVQIISIQNTGGVHIQMEVQAIEYQKLGYLVAEIKNDSILLNTKTTTGTKTIEYITITIDGDLPYNNY